MLRHFFFFLNLVQPLKESQSGLRIVAGAGSVKNPMLVCFQLVTMGARTTGA